ncbi:MAG: bifunctional adenosylcobinamide kinase/adenosylcobinamide-phosphate guanylyltransferase [Aliarcobacter sp.]|jgi:adenosylcobinamide kinase/adenosylcobinamide-phosphate guanylyltransferase|nr:bifunctional adenosylcobinamide kinase/adenosylcobinamide-phosphate guanylyltransferase [Aliarcobacter sp.]
MSKIFYFGGQKSGKTKAGSKKALDLAQNSKPYYVATYDNSYGDVSMNERINRHISERKDDFICIEEAKDLTKVIEENNTYLVDCISMWLLNNLLKSEDELKQQLRTICKIDANIIFILNDVSCGVIPLDSESRKFVDFSGLLGQELASLCDEVYEVKYGIERRLK